MAKTGPRPRPLAERFARFVVPEPNSGCWWWVGALDRHGYGRFSVARCVARFAHRVMWELERGEIPGGMDVLHHCDVGACVNPGHLWVGTARDNTQDCARKGRLGIQRDPASYAARLQAWRQAHPGDSPRSLRRHRQRERVAGEALG